MSGKGEIKQEIDVVSGSMEKNIFDSDTNASNTIAKKYLSDRREDDESGEDSSRFLPRIIR